ncbi:alpha/beta fold family hydrolase [Gemmatirosa kalamazoonensis]|uniref:Alpha/beta fold family hydrolase n=1 Tax=Gemmatirosa kalamazoonensis TaxID=861299 RepID=W0RCA0_9BACT|nr:alpha/beta hydrolase [Gemmatirosa kalamazoonensis]AHG88699.1 alpha/beta fold family hydrolase [Gemmatirosa kalamazoonensis]
MTAAPATRRTTSLAVLVAACLAACNPAPSVDAPPAERLRLHPCFLVSLFEPARCGTFRVPERRVGAHSAGTVRRTLGLRVVVLPARTRPAAREPLVLLHGGPGIGAAEQPRYADAVFAEARRTRDVVLVDQRGTGRSNPLACDLYDDGGRLQPYLDPMFPLGAVRRCAARLARRADLSEYGTDAAADDLDDLRAALGAERLDLFGVSYGTRAALVYLRRHPSHVRRVVLQGVVAPDEPIPLAAGRAGERALDYLAADCAADAACRRDVPNPEGDVARVMVRLREAPAVVELWNGRRLSTERVRISARGFAERLWSMLYSPGDDRETARLVHAAALGALTPFAEAALHESRARRRRSEGMMLSVLCAEDAPRLARADTARAAAGALLGLPVARELLAACAAWPVGPRDPLGGASALATPALLLSGEVDPIAPPEWAERARRLLPNSVHLVQPRGGHAELAGCAPRLVAAFLDAADPRRLGRTCWPSWDVVAPDGVTTAGRTAFEHGAP